MSSPRIRCLLTFDYELFHGRNAGSAEEVLFAPTDALRERCAALGVPVTWFPDVCSAWWHREHGDAAFAERFEAQMRDALAAGDDVQLHVHPHWLFTTPADGGDGARWRLDPERCFLHEIGQGDGPREAQGLLRHGVAWLEELLRPVDPAYRCVAYRAAALALEPRGREHLQALADAGLRIDSSVVKGVQSDTDTYFMDYRDPPPQANWWIQPETGWRVPAAKGLWEVPVGSFQAPLATRVGFLVRRLRAVGRRRGTGMSRTQDQTRLGNLWHLVRMNLRYVTGSPWFTLSCDTKGFDRAMVLDGLRDHVRRHADHAPGGEIAVSVINHPKLMFEAERDLLAGFVEDARRAFGEALEFTTYRDLAAERDAPARDRGTR